MSVSEIQDLKTAVINVYLDWLNNYLTLEGMASAYNLDKRDISYLVYLGRKLYSKTKEG